MNKSTTISGMAFQSYVFVSHLHPCFEISRFENSSLQTVNNSNPNALQRLGCASLAVFLPCKREKEETPDLVCTLITPCCMDLGLWRSHWRTLSGQWEQRPQLGDASYGEGAAYLTGEARFSQEKDRRNKVSLLVLECFIIPIILITSDQRMRSWTGSLGEGMSHYWCDYNPMSAKVTYPFEL